MEPSFIMQLIEKFGLPLALCVGLAFAGWKILQKMLASHENTIQEYRNVLREKETQLTNHLTHLQAGVEQMCNKMESNEKSFSVVGDRIISAIENQTKLFIEIARKSDSDK